MLQSLSTITEDEDEEEDLVEVITETIVEAITEDVDTTGKRQIIHLSIIISSTNIVGHAEDLNTHPRSVLSRSTDIS